MTKESLLEALGEIKNKALFLEVGISHLEEGLTWEKLEERTLKVLDEAGEYQLYNRLFDKMDSANGFSNSKFMDGLDDAIDWLIIFGEREEEDNENHTRNV